MSDLSTVRLSLEEKLKELTDRAEEIDDDLSQPGDDDSAENAVESEDDEVLEKIGSATLVEIRQIKLAIGRIDDGTYGICAACGGTIGEERLEALPSAIKCVRCS